jgi:hypothetical protein
MHFLDFALAFCIRMLLNIVDRRRGTLAFFAILVGVGLSATGNVFASSLATMFPAVFLSTMVGLWISHEVTSSVFIDGNWPPCRSLTQCRRQFRAAP